MKDDEKFWLICSKQQLLHAQCIEFSVPVEKLAPPTHKIAGFVLNWKGDYFAYLNSCPHTGVNLNWLPNQFFDPDSRLLQCSTHGALFEPGSGLCVRGPCLAQSLSTLPLCEDNDSLYIELDKLSMN